MFSVKTLVVVAALVLAWSAAMSPCATGTNRACELSRLRAPETPSLAMTGRHDIAVRQAMLASVD